MEIHSYRDTPKRGETDAGWCAYASHGGHVVEGSHSADHATEDAAREATAAKVGMSALDNLIRASWDADEAWSRELVRVFGPAGQWRERYLPQGRGAEGSELRRLHDAKSAAMEAEHAAWGRYRASKRAAEAHEA